MPLKISRNSDIITSRSNPLVVRLSKLEEKKHREDARLFRLDGIKLALEALAFGAEIEYIVVREDRLARFYDEAEGFFSDKEVSFGGELVVLGESAFSKLSPEKSPEGIITVVRYLDSLHKIRSSTDALSFCEDDKLLMLESVRDPGNMGTILRSAAAFGISAVIMSRDCADIYNPKVLRGAMGAVFKVKTFSTNDIVSDIGILRKNGRRVLAAALDEGAMKLGSFTPKGNDVFLIGNEGHGLSFEAVNASDRSVFIPMEEGTESLNAAVAASVCLWEMSKAR